MASESLRQKLTTLKAYRQTRLDVAQYVLRNPHTFPELLEYCFHFDSEISYRACWVLEFVCLEQRKLLASHLDLFFTQLPKVYKDQALRPLAKLCEHITEACYKDKDPLWIDAFTSQHKEQMIECCFDWLLGEEKVACKVYAMSALYYLGNEFNWIHPELHRILTETMHAHSAAYRARGRHILKKLQTLPRE
ncbi:adenylosuccinate lyase [Altibacter sp.]|uniref:adenylosuccinate lyase n=1 Tax=Altibacter sp. TaxID=2024823 RepID=UPI000C97B71C|nr:adenylosuccinate lyase [Altibacter sp.]MAP54118.1 adenylosuccinate lyase [Altibacter sp.]